MPLYQSDAIILKTYPLGEADRIVSFFSRDRGKMRGVANGARRMKNRFGASLEPLAHSHVMFFEKENRDLVSIRSADLLDSSMKLFEDYDRAVVAAHIVELTDRFLPEHQPHDAVFRLIRMMVPALERGCPLEFAECYFDVWMLRFAGVFPEMFQCAVCATILDIDVDRFLTAGLQRAVCGNCTKDGNVTVHPEVAVILKWILKNRLETQAAEYAQKEYERGTKNLHELNQYWIRHYSER